ncbi:RHS repeat-associated protein [Aquimarina sp. MAR_2010_214]|uniref:M91 family zinc metallopeptidase n=1 Tax=Aquimarina sp. MAR_2010_214 TaxID=1250026 RepID=UPI000C70769F|nr:M91 family zinc metallopeptidase [Aquimarina sp. MAR_2010_214]PKV50833.1 RHS repeat-associated protein [Aquimarina sp. MAR_2010_214]
MRRVILFFLCTIATTHLAFSQNPFEEFNYQPKMGTLSKGKYIEHFDNDSIVRIGSVLFNTYNHQISAFAVEDTLYSEATLDPTVMSRWMNPDPLSDEFPDKSPYNFVNNNPIRYVDPLGLAPEDVIIQGDKEFRDAAFANLQSLTDSQLAMDKNGNVTIVESGCNSGCNEGQNLVDGLVSSDKVVTIVNSPDDKNHTIPFDQEGAVTTNEGDSTVEFNPNNTNSGVDVSGNKNRPSEIGLAHELGHSRDIANGTEPIGASNFVTPFKDLPDSERFQQGSFINNTLRQLTKREAKIRNSVENPIRRERGLKARKMVKLKNFRYESKY